MRTVFTFGGWIAAALLVGYLLPHSGNVLAAPLQQIRSITLPGEAAPIARYSHAVVVPANEELIFVSGAGGDDAKGNIVSPNIVDQTRQTMENLKKVLAASGSDFSHVVKVNIFLTDMDHMPDVRKVRDAYLDPNHPPAMTTAKVSDLVGGIKIEIELVAVRKKG
jgi:2-iminobutanoate/2-iminopropanoate deaminase